jgi:hypothetical protein
LYTRTRAWAFPPVTNHQSPATKRLIARAADRMLAKPMLEWSAA